MRASTVTTVAAHKWGPLGATGDAPPSQTQRDKEEADGVDSVEDAPVSLGRRDSEESLRGLARSSNKRLQPWTASANPNFKLCVLKIDFSSCAFTIVVREP